MDVSGCHFPRGFTGAWRAGGAWPESQTGAWPESTGAWPDKSISKNTDKGIQTTKKT